MKITISPHLSGATAVLAIAITLLLVGVVPACADVTPVVADQTTGTNSPDSSTLSDSPQPKPTHQPPKPTYTPITARKQLNYYTTMGRNTAYKVYKTGGYNTSAANQTAVGTSRQFAGKPIHITQSEQASGITWLKFTYNHKFSGWVNQHATVSTTYKLWVPLIAQRPQLPTGCEITATAMMLQFAGAKVTKLSLTREMPRSSDPNKGFVGSPYSKSGWYIYPKAVLPIVKRHLGSAQNLTGARLSTIKKYVRHDHPVVVYVAGVDGFSNHALTVTGYSKTRIYYNDPWTNKRASMSNSVMTKHRKADANRAFSY